jgi:hypothetical protein
MTELRDFENNLRATLADVASSADEPPGLADRLVTGATRRRAPHRVRVWLGRRWVPPALAAAAVAVVAVATVATVTLIQADRPTRPAHPPPTPAPTRSESPTPSVKPTSSPPSSTSARPSTPLNITARDWDIDGDGRPDRGQLVFLGGSGPNNWELVVTMTSLGRQIVPFTGQIALPGSIDVTIAGSVDADHDGHAEVFVMDSSGASTQSWTIFKLADRHLVQVTAASQPVDLKAGGSVTHLDGFRCAGSTLITTSETTGPPDYKTISFRRTTYAWHGARLQQTSQQTGTFTGTVKAAVDCGDLPQRAPNQPAPPQTSTPSATASPPAASGRWTDSPLVITAHSLGAVTRGMTLAQAKTAAGTSLSLIGDSIFRPTDRTITGSTVLQFSYGATCFDAHRSGSGPGTIVTTTAGVQLGDPMNQISAAYGSRAKPFTADPTWTGPGNIPAGIVVQQGDGVLLFVGSTPDHRGGTITSIRGAADAFGASSVFC